MPRRHSLRLRVAFAFAGLGAVLSLLLTGGIWFAAHDVSQRLMDQTLQAELEDYMARRARNPYSLPPDTASFRGYLDRAGAPDDDLPAQVRTLPPGQHEMTLDKIPYRIAIAEREGDRYLILFNEERQQHREQRFLGYLVIGASAMTLLAALGGLWLAGRVIAPVTELARSVGMANPAQPPKLPPKLPRTADPGDEIDELARAFDHYLKRLAAFVERERTFAADASHELRTPLAVIRGAAEVLADDARLTPDQSGRVARIERAAEDMADLIDALLLLAREEEMATEEAWDAVKVAHQCAERYRPLATSRQTTLELMTTPVELHTPSALFAIVVANLLRNAVAHTRNGHIGVTLDAHALTVSDSGSGIDRAALDHVFERYYRGSESAGAGIGLSLVKRICDRLDWTIDLQSDPLRGTRITLGFPPHAGA